MSARSPGLAIWSPGAHSCSSFNLLRRHGCLLDRSALHRQPRREQADPLHRQVHRVRTGGSVLSSLCIWATWNLFRQYSWAGRWKTVGKPAKRRFDGGFHIFSLVCKGSLLFSKFEFSIKPDLRVLSFFISWPYAVFYKMQVVFYKSAHFMYLWSINSVFAKCDLQSSKILK